MSSSKTAIPPTLDRSSLTNASNSENLTTTSEASNLHTLQNSRYSLSLPCLLEFELSKLSDEPKSQIMEPSSIEPIANPNNPSAISPPEILRPGKSTNRRQEVNRSNTGSSAFSIPICPPQQSSHFHSKKFINFINREASETKNEKEHASDLTRSSSSSSSSSPLETILHPALRSFFYLSPQAIFVIPAKPLWYAISRRRCLGKAEDPEEHGAFSKSNPGDFDGICASLMEDNFYPLSNRNGPEIGASCNLSELLRPKYVNPVAKEIACKALELNPKGINPCDSWDLMKLLARQDLSRWLLWIKEVLDSHDRSKSLFQTEIQTAEKRMENLQSLKKKRLMQLDRTTINHEASPDPSTKLTKRSLGVLMTATIYDSSACEGNLNPLRSKEPSENEFIVFSSVVLRRQDERKEDTFNYNFTKWEGEGQVAKSHHKSQYDPTTSNNALKHTSSKSKLCNRSTDKASISRSKAFATNSDLHRSMNNLGQAISPLDSTSKLLCSEKKDSHCRFDQAKCSSWARTIDPRPMRKNKKNRNDGCTIGTPGKTPLTRSSTGRVLAPYHFRHRSFSSPLENWLKEEGRPAGGQSIPSPGNDSNCSQETEVDYFGVHRKKVSTDTRNVIEPAIFSSPARLYQFPNNNRGGESELSNKHKPTVDVKPKFPEIMKRSSQDSTIRRNCSSKSSSTSSLRTVNSAEFCLESFCKSLMITPMGHIIREFDWGKTPIGPIESWSTTLKSMVGLILSSPYRTSLLWGKECVMLYNDAYVKTCGRKHPSLLGQSGSKGWAELWADLGEVADSVLQGETYTVYDSLLFFDRDPDNPQGIRKEECYHSFSWIPIRGPMGGVEGIFNISFETTSRVISERRLRTLRDLVQISLVSKTQTSYKEGCLEVLSKNPYDLPFAIMYTCENKNRSKVTSNTADGSKRKLPAGKAELQLRLAGTIGVPPGHPSTPEILNIIIPVLNQNTHSGASLGPNSPSTSSAASQQTVIIDAPDDRNDIWSLKEACTCGKPIYIADLGGRAKGFDLRGWNDEPSSAVVMPLSTSESTPPLAIFVFGISPRLYWSEAYALFLNLLTRQLSTGLSAAIGHEEEAERLEELAALNRAKTTFFTNISHELRTPLTLIVGPVSEILGSKFEMCARARDRLEIVERNTQRLINLVNQLLDLSRFEAGKMAARFRKTDISKFTAGLVALFRSEMLKKNIELVVDCPETLKRAWVDQDFLEKVIFNLMSNCLKFTPPGGRVVVQVCFDATQCCLICSDTGVGIRKDELPRIFDRFHRVENTERKAEGTGIGLALVQDIVKLHHGRLEVESEVDQGSKFTVAFQLGNEHLPAELIEHVSETKLEIINDRVMNSNARRWMLGDIEPSQNTAMIESPSASEVSSSRGSWDSLTSFVAQESVLSTVGSSILIADDNSDMRRFLMSVLSRYFVVKEASNGLEAFRLAKVHQPDLVLTDVMMPGIDGFQLLKKLKEDSETAGISVILLSACAGSENRIEGLSQGADDYLVKPFEAKELVARINTHLQQCKLRQRLESAVVHRTELLQENEQKYRDLYHTFEAISMLSPVGIIKLDICGRITFSNNSFHSQCSLSTDNTIEDWIDQIFLEDKGRMKQRFDDMFRRRQPTKGEFRWKNGSWCLYELTPYYQEDDQFFGFLGSTTDVSDRKEAERKQLEAAEARARDAEESKRQQEAFIDMTSHEIRNPLHGIHQAADLVHSSLKLLQQSADDNDCIKGEELERFRLEIEEDIDAIESIQLCASHQSRIADDIINVSKLSMGLLTTVKTEFDLVDRVREVLSMYYIEAQQKGVDLELQTGHGVGSSEYICADPNRLAQVTINFLSNALRYASNSDGQRKVTVKVDIFTSCPEPQPDGRRIGNLRPLQAEPGNEMVFAQVAVQDTARGLSAEELAKLFARFAQANPTQDQYGGSGLGLYVSHRLIENHGGFIEVVSTKGVGSIFSFVIPAKKGREKSHSDEPPRSSSRRGFARSIKQHEAPEMRPASTLLPAGSMPLSGALNRYPSPDGQKNHSFQKHLRRKTMSNSSLSSRKINSEASVQTSPPYDLTSSMSKAAHVLVVEDNLINVKVIKRQLTLKGYAVSVAMDGRKALDVLYADGSESSRLSLIDIVLMDIQMPVMSGLEAIAELRKAEKSGNIRKRYPVIAVTGNARKEQMEQCLESGFDSICVKPYKIDDIEKQMKRLLESITKKPS